VQNRLNCCIHGVIDVQLLDSLLIICAILHMRFLIVDVIEDMDRLFYLLSDFSRVIITDPY